MSTTLDIAGDVAAPDARAIIDLLTGPRGGGFERADAEHQAAQYSPQQVLDAIANAECLAAQGKLVNRRGYIVRALQHGYPLRPEIQRQRDEARQKAIKKAAYEAWAVQRLRAIVAGRGEQAARWLDSAFGGAEAVIAAGCLTVADLASDDPDRVWRRLEARAPRPVAARPS